VIELIIFSFWCRYDAGSSSRLGGRFFATTTGSKGTGRPPQQRNALPMSSPSPRGNEVGTINRRILVVDDNRAIHDDFTKILCRESQATTALDEVEAELFGERSLVVREEYEIDSAFQGEEGLARVEEALAQDRPYAVAFIDVRMPPGWDGIETASRIWEVDPNLQIVICTAYSDYSWKQILAKLGRSDRLVILKKPFDNIEVLQLADGLTRKWQRAHDGNRHLAALQQLIRERSNELSGVNGSSDIGNGELSMAAEVADTQIRQQLVLEDDLRHALESGQLSVQYQPLVEIATQRVAGLEVLARWQHPTKGWISPGTFIPIAEHSGLILSLGEFVLRTACEQVVRWDREGVPICPVSVNLSAVQLRRQNVVEIVRKILHETGMRPHNLVLELTESALIENLQEHSDALQTLRRDGVGIEIDDFGTGYSSLSYLKQLPVDGIKIDRSFIRQIDTNVVDASIVSAIVAMAHSVGLNVVAEGVETAAQLRVLGTQGCDVAQGFYFARPMPPEDCRNMLTATTGRQSFTDTLRLLASGEIVELHKGPRTKRA
jgi:EAL domain-containing protein (putative c-di-GMP-specific phosphodiesterase class I)/CheY-like chemotaxis protein